MRTFPGDGRSIWWGLIAAALIGLAVYRSKVESKELREMEDELAKVAEKTTSLDAVGERIVS